MTDITELAKKHGAEVYMLGKRESYLDQNRISMTPDQLRAIIREASQPLVLQSESLVSLWIEQTDVAWMYNSEQTFKDLTNALAEFNKEFGE